MELTYKEDWEDTKERFKAWWAHENFGRCGLAVSAPKDDAPQGELPQRPADHETAWRDLDYYTALNEYNHKRTFYGGEAFPHWRTGYPGHKSMGAFMGCNVELKETTGWLNPIWTNEGFAHESITIDENNRHFQYALKEQRRAVKEADGKSFAGICCAFGASGDILAWLRGSDKLLFDVMDRPSEVRDADTALVELWWKTYKRFFEITQEGAEGACDYFSLWAPGTVYTPQNDFAYMISPKLFEYLFLPSIARQVELLDYSIYHLDGVGNFGNLDAILDLSNLNAVQVLPGAGKPSQLHYMPLLKKVQAAGKNVHLNLRPEEVETALTELSAQGLFIVTNCKTESDARKLLKDAEKWSHK